MDFDALVDEVLRRVLEKIRQLEARGIDVDTGSCDKPKVLVLTQPGGTDRDKILTCPDLNLRYVPELAIDNNYNCVLLGYDAVFAFDLTNDVIRKVSEGRCDDGYSRLLSQALASDKKVYIPAETVEMWNGGSDASPLLNSRLQKDMDTLRAGGAVIAHLDDIFRTINGQPAASSCSFTSAPAVATNHQQFIINASANMNAVPVREIVPSVTECTPVPSKEMSFYKRCITRNDVVAAEHEGATVLVICKNAIITDVAKEKMAKDGLTVDRRLDSSSRG